MIIKYNNSYYEPWQEAVNGSGELFHDIRWHQIIKETYRIKPEYYMNVNNGKILGGFPAFRVKNKLLSIPYLPFCGAWGKFPNIEKLQKQTGNTIYTKDFCNSNKKINHNDYVIMRLEIPKTEEDLWANIGPKTRNLIRKANKNSFIYKDATVDEFYPIYCKATNALGTPPHKKTLFQLINKLFNRSVNIKTVNLGAKVVSCIIEIDYNGIRYDLWAFSLKQFFPLAPNMFLYYKSLISAIESGINIYDFGRSQYGNGTYFFKKQWGARPKKIENLIYDKSGVVKSVNSKRSVLTQKIPNIWKRIPTPIANFIGPIIRKFIV